MSWKGQLRGVATWHWCHDTGRLGDRNWCHDSSWCRDMGGSLGRRDMVFVLRSEASLWAEMGSRPCLGLGRARVVTTRASEQGGQALAQCAPTTWALCARPNATVRRLNTSVRAMLTHCAHDPVLSLGHCLVHCLWTLFTNTVQKKKKTPPVVGRHRLNYQMYMF